MSNVGILGIGLHLPEQVRSNNWWPTEVVARWRQRQGGSFASPTGLVADDATGPLPNGARLIAAAIAAERDDPFQGVRERRIAPEGTYASDMELLAARDALNNAGVAAGEIDFVLSYSTCPDYLMAPNACAVHHKLGLRRDVLSLSTEGACNSFLIQLALAEQLIAGARFRRGLLVQSSMCSRLVPPEQPSSAILGDAATAVVVGPVTAGYGVLGRSHATDGTHFNALAVGVPGRRWYEEGRNVFYAADKEVARRLILSVADRAREATHAALADAGLGAGDVAFYASHQGTSWLRRVTQTHSGLDHARSLDSFAWAASVMGVNVPLVLAVAARECKVESGDVVVAFSGGLGETWSSLVVRWGCG